MSGATPASKPGGLSELPALALNSAASSPSEALSTRHARTSASAFALLIISLVSVAINASFFA